MRDEDLIASSGWKPSPTIFPHTSQIEARTVELPHAGHVCFVPALDAASESCTDSIFHDSRTLAKRRLTGRGMCDA